MKTCVSTIDMRALQQNTFRTSFRAFSTHQTHRSGLLTDSYPMTWDINKSTGSYLVHAETGDKYLDFN